MTSFDSAMYCKGKILQIISAKVNIGHKNGRINMEQGTSALLFGKEQGDPNSIEILVRT